MVGVQRDPGTDQNIIRVSRISMKGHVHLVLIGCEEFLHCFNSTGNLSLSKQFCRYPGKPLNVHQKSFNYRGNPLIVQKILQLLKKSDNFSVNLWFAKNAINYTENPWIFKEILEIILEILQLPSKSCNYPGDPLTPTIVRRNFRIIHRILGWSKMFFSINQRIHQNPLIFHRILEYMNWFIKYW